MTDAMSPFFEATVRTATPLGPSSIYGAGLLNLEKALQPIGTVLVATGASAGGHCAAWSPVCPT